MREVIAIVISLSEVEEILFKNFKLKIEADSVKWYMPQLITRQKNLKLEEITFIANKYNQDYISIKSALTILVTSGFLKESIYFVGEDNEFEV